MSISAGTVTVADNGTRTGSGAALALYDAMLAMPSIAATLALPETMPENRGAFCSAAAKLSLKRGQAEVANAIAALAAYIRDNATVSGNATVSTQKLGRLPTSIVAGQAIDAPASPVTVPVTGTLA